MRELPAKYFPVSAKPLMMEAGFSPITTDFGNGSRDQLYFQRDQEWARYLDAKSSVPRERHWAVIRSSEHVSLHLEALRWITATQERELNESTLLEVSEVIDQLEQRGEATSEAELSQAYHSLSLRVQEDISLLAMRPRSSLVVGEISMPSHWAPERIKEASFWEIHHPVPGFPRDQRVSERLGKMITERGPLVRFVWTLTGDDQLDHHPSHPRTELMDQLWLRVERQVSIPFSGQGALFLIRTYLYPIQRLEPTERDLISEALRVMPEEVARYKGLWDDQAHMIHLLSMR